MRTKQRDSQPSGERPTPSKTAGELAPETGLDADQAGTARRVSRAPEVLTPTGVAWLQRTIGNRAVGRPGQAGSRARDLANSPRRAPLTGTTTPAGMEAVQPTTLAMIQRYADENDPTVFQGGAAGTACPLTLRQLFQVFTLDRDVIAFPVINREGRRQTVRFTREWVSGHQGLAVLRGRIRYEISQQIPSQGEAILDTINSLRGDQIRIEELGQDYQTARLRHESNPGQARTTGAHLVEEARGPGVSHNDRGGSAGLHAAWDIAGPRNTGVYAPVEGVVVFAGRTAGYGKRLKILHPNGPDQRQRPRPVYTNYCHLDEVLVAVGDRIHPGQAVGLMGNMRFDLHGVTTIRGINTHLHFSVQSAPRGTTAEEANTGLSSDYERAGGFDARPWFTSVTGSPNPYHTLTAEPTSADQTREVLELEGQGVREFRRRQGRGAASRYSPAALGPITRPAPAGNATVQEKADPSLGMDGRQPVRRTPAEDRRPIPAVQRQPALGSVIQCERPEYITSHTFLGIDIPVDRGVHPTMKDRLTDVQGALQSQFDALPSEGKPATLREYAGVHTIKGYRETTTLHGTGRAVDVNYDDQPYIATRTVTATATTYGGERPPAVEGETPAQTRARHRQLGALRRPAVEVYDRAVSFLRTDSSASDTADVGNRREGETAAAAYRRFRRTSDALRDYLSLAFQTDHTNVERLPIQNPERASAAVLLRSIPTSERKDEADAISAIEAVMGDAAWQATHPNYPLTAREQFFRILRDYEIVRKPMQYGNPSVRPARTRNPARGFLHLPEHFVVAMMDVGRLRWGACEFSARSNGDVHHFDLGDPHHVPAVE